MRAPAATLVALTGLFVAACGSRTTPAEQGRATNSGADVADVSDAARALMLDTAQMRSVHGDFGWAEGPVWVEDDGGYLLMTDVPGKTIWKFTDEAGLSKWMSPSTNPDATVTGSGGANGLTRLNASEVIVPDHGTRTLYAVDVLTRKTRTLADSYEGRPLNSPNDAALHENGTIYFTDPPYGLSGDGDPLKAQPVNGVYALSPSGAVTLIDGSLERPNGIALSPDQRWLYVTNSNTDAVIKRYPVEASGAVGEGIVWQDFSDRRAEPGAGNLDGLVVARDGTLFVSGLGGATVLSPAGDVLGTIDVGERCANAELGGADGSTLYLTCHTSLYTVPTNRRAQSD